MNDRASLLQSLLAERILILDGAMGTMIQRERLSEEQFRGERFRGWGRDLRGNNDLLTLTQPALIRRIHLDYLLPRLTAKSRIIPLFHAVVAHYRRWNKVLQAALLQLHR